MMHTNTINLLDNVMPVFCWIAWLIVKNKTDVINEYLYIEVIFSFDI